MRAVRQLPFPVDPVVEDRTTRVRLGLDFTRRIERHVDEPLVLMTQRKRLDAYLVEQAVRAGAEFRDGVKVTDLVLDGRRRRGAGRRLAGRRNARAARPTGRTASPRVRVGPRRRPRHGVALEANVPYGVVSEDEYRGLLCLELANVPGRVRLGLPEGRPRQRGRRRLGARRPAAARAPGALLPRVRHSGVEPRGRPRPPAAARPRRARGSRRGAWRSSATPRGSSTRSPATASTRRSSRPGWRPRPSSPATSRATTASCGARSPRSSSAAWGAKVALDRFPRLTYAVVRTPFLWNAVVSLIGGDVPSPSAMRGLRRVSMRAVEAIARAAGNPGKAYRARD